MATQMDPDEPDYDQDKYESYLDMKHDEAMEKPKKKKKDMRGKLRTAEDKKNFIKAAQAPETISTKHHHKSDEKGYCKFCGKDMFRKERE